MSETTGLAPAAGAGAAPTWTQFDGMTWPLPNGDLEWRLRYGAPSESDRMYAASIVAAYAELVCCAAEKRATVIRQIRKTMLAAPRAGATTPEKGEVTP